MTLRFYLSGPMTGLPEFNFPAFTDAAMRLRENGYHVLSAHEITHGVAATGSLSWATYLRKDLAELVTCDALVLLKGWPRSNGARLELYVALALDMPVYAYNGQGGLREL